jgi:cytoskeletal protein RodZ
MHGIFISYRRADSKAVTSRIYDRLVAAFSKRDVFKDVDNIPLGKDFRSVLGEATAGCKVMLIVIGSDWVSITDSAGRRRLEDPEDFARLEVETGLQNKGLTVIPLLVEGASMPGVGELPEALRELAFKNAFTIHDDPLFHRDMDILIRQLRGLLRPNRTRLWWSIAAVLLLLIGAGAAFAFLNQRTVTAGSTATAVVQAAVTDSPEPSATTSPTQTLSPTAEIVQKTATPQAPTEDVRTIVIAIVTQAALDMTSTATQWTATSTATLTATATSTATNTPNPEKDQTERASTISAQQRLHPTATAVLSTASPTLTPTDIPTRTLAASATPTSITCLGALPSHLYIGVLARVVSGGGPNRVRNAPGLHATQTGLIDPGKTFVVIGGPRCVDGYVWYETNSGGWTAEGTDSDYWIEPVSESVTPEAQ